MISVKKDKTHHELVKENQALKKTIEDYQALITQLPGNVYCYDAKGKIVFASQKALNDINRNFKGKPCLRKPIKQGDLLGNNLPDSVHSLDQLAIKNSQQSLEALQDVTFENGESCVFLSLKQHFKHANQNFIIGTSIDITEYKKYEEYLESCIEQLKQVNDAKDEFILNLNHDLRTPCNGINGILGQILEQSDLNDDLVSRLHTIQQSTQSIIKLINQFISFFKNKSGKVEYTAVNVQDIFENIILILKPIMLEKQIELSHDIQIPQLIITDASYLHRIILNLISNAIVHNPIQTQIEVRIHQEVKNVSDEAILHFTIKDNGIGMSPDAKRAVLNYFDYHNSQYDEYSQILGVGLPSCKHLIEKLSGHLSIRDNRPSGSIISWHIPTKIMGAHKYLKLQDRIKSNQKIKHYENVKYVLIIEDDPVSLTYLKSTLIEMNLHVTTASSIYEVTRLEKRSFDLVIADLNLGDGHATQIMNIDIEYDHIICLTADDNINADSFLKGQFDQILHKPITKNKIKQLLNTSTKIK